MHPQHVVPSASTIPFHTRRRLPARANALVLSLGLVASASVLAPPVAQAAPTYAEFEFTTTVNATRAGGDEAIPLRIIARYDLDLVPGSDPFGSSEDGTFDSYAPLSRYIVELGDECISATGAGTAVTVFNNSSGTLLEDSIDIRTETPATDGLELLGLPVELVRFLPVDEQGTMFEDTSLPANDAPFADADFAQAEIGLRQEDGKTVFVSAFNAPFQISTHDPAGSVRDLQADVVAILPDATRAAPLLAELDKALAVLRDANLTNDGDVSKHLKKFIAKVKAAQGGPKKITKEQADSLIGSAQVNLNSVPACF